MKTTIKIFLALLLIFPGILKCEIVYISISGSFIKMSNCKALVVSNQFGTLKYFTFVDEFDYGEDFSLEIEREEGEALAITMISIDESKDNPNESKFTNVTFCNINSGVYIDRPPAINNNIQTQMIELKISSIFDLEEVKIPLLLGEPRYERVGNDLNIKYIKPINADVFVLLKCNDFKTYKYYYSNNTEKEVHYVSGNELKDKPIKIKINLPVESKWFGRITGVNKQRGTNCQLFYELLTPKNKIEESNFIEFYLPENQKFTNYQVSLENNKTHDGYSFFLSSENIPYTLPEMEIIEGFEEISNQYIHLKVEQDKKILKLRYVYKSNYTFQNSKQTIASTWTTQSPLNGEEEFKFHLPNLPKEMIEKFHCLENIDQPSSCTKELLSGAALNDDYYWMEPMIINSSEWLMDHNIIIRKDYHSF